MWRINCDTVLYDSIDSVFLNLIKGHAYRYKLSRLTWMLAAELANHARALDGVIQEIRCCIVQ